MKQQVGILESLCAGYSLDLAQPLPDNFLKEGFEMLQSISRALSQGGDESSIAFVHESIVESRRPRFRHHALVGTSRRQILDEVCSAATKLGLSTLIVIAPECERELADLLQELALRDLALWNCSVSFVLFASDKYAVSQFCASHGIPHPKTELLSSVIQQNRWLQFPGKLVIKPRDGAGCFQLKIFENSQLASLHVAKNSQQFESPSAWVVQDWVPGLHASRSMVAHREGFETLPWMTQEFDIIVGENEGLETLSYRGAKGLPHVAESCGASTFEKLWNAFPQQILGWVGFDFVLPSSPDGHDSEPVLIEINPRFTTSIASMGEITIWPFG